MIILIFLLNLPWTIVGLLASILSVPRSVTFSKNPPAVIIYVRSFWWYRWLPGQAGVRAITNGYVVQMSKWADDFDLKHELIHVDQHIRMPFVFPFLNMIEQIQHGRYQGNGRGNKYEVEAYEKSGNRFGYFVGNFFMDIKILRNQVTREELAAMAAGQFGEWIKAVVDVEREIMAIGGQWHADTRAVLLGQGGKQEDMWGINLHPEKEGDGWIEFNSMINIRPLQGNRSRGVENSAIQKKIRNVVQKWIF